MLYINIYFLFIFHYISNLVFIYLFLFIYFFFVEKICVCTYSGDPHTLTFYDKWIHFQGTCTYSLMAASHNRDNVTCDMAVDGKFRQRNPNRAVSMLERIYITIGSHQIIFDQGNKIKV